MHDAAQDIEMPRGRVVWHQVHARLDDHRTPALRIERRFDGLENFAVGERKPFDVRTVEIREVDLLQSNWPRS